MSKRELRLLRNLMKGYQMKMLLALLIASVSVVVDAGEWQRYRGATRHYYQPTGPTRPYYGYIDPNPPRVSFSDMFDSSRTQRGRQYIIENGGPILPNGVQFYYPYQLYGQQGLSW